MSRKSARALETVRFILGEHAILSEFSAHVTWPGNREMPLHIDQWFMPHPVDPRVSCGKCPIGGRQLGRTGSPVRAMITTRTCPLRAGGHLIRSGARGAGTVAGPRRTQAGERGAARADLPPERGDPAHQRDPRPRHRPARGRRVRLRAHRRPLRGHRDRRRGGGDPGLREQRPHRGRAPADGGMAGRAAALRTPARPLLHPENGGRDRLRSRPRLLHGPASRADARRHGALPPGRACRQLLPRREGRRTGVHRRGRGGPGAVRLAGGGGHRQRAHVPRRAAGPRRPPGPGRYLTGRRRGLRCRDRHAALVQPGGKAHRRGSCAPRASRPSNCCR